MQEKIRHLTEEIETIEKNQTEILELKNTISEIKNSLNGLNGRRDERVHELEDRSIEMIYSEIQREKAKNKFIESQRSIQDNTKKSNVCIKNTKRIHCQ